MKTIILLLALISGTAHAIGNSSLGFSFNPQQKSARNYVKNPNAERTVSRYVTYTNTSGTRNTTNPILGAADFQFTIDSATDTVDFDLYTFDQKLKNNNCIVQLDYKSASASVELQVRRSATTIASATLTSTSDPKSVMVPFGCGDLSAATSIRISGTSATSTIVNVGNIFVGSASASSAVINTGGEWVGRLTRAGAAGCSWLLNSASYSNFSADADCSTGVATGDVADPGSKVPAVTVKNVNPSYAYVFKVGGGYFGQDTNSDGCSYRISDGTDSSDSSQLVYNSGAIIIATGQMEGTVVPTSSGDKTYHVQNRYSFGAKDCVIQAGNSAFNFTIDVFRFPKKNSSTGSIFEAGDYGWTDMSSLFTVTGSGTVTNKKIFVKRVGDTAYVRGGWTNGTTAATAASLDFPSSLLIDLTKLSSGSKGAKVGFATAAEGNTTDSIFAGDYERVVFTDGSDDNSVFFAYQVISGTGYSKGQASTIWLNNKDTKLDFSVPIKGWSTFPFGVSGGIGVPVSARVSGNPGATSTGASPVYPTVNSDPNGMYSAGLFTFPANKTHCQIMYYWVGDAPNLRAACYKNGSFQNTASDNYNNGPGVQNGVCFFDGSAGDTFNVRPTNTAMTGSANDNAHATCW